MDGTPHSVDPDGLMEFSVVFTDRSLNHMSKAFQGVMNDIRDMLSPVDDSRIDTSQFHVVGDFINGRFKHPT